MAGALSGTALEIAAKATGALSTTAAWLTSGTCTCTVVGGVCVACGVNFTSIGKTGGGAGGVGAVIGMTQRCLGVGCCGPARYESGINNNPPASKCNAAAVLVARTREVSMPVDREKTCDCVRTIIHLLNGTAERTSATRTQYTIR